MEDHVPGGRDSLLVAFLGRRSRDEVLRRHRAQNKHNQERDNHNYKNILSQRPKQSLH